MYLITTNDLYKVAKKCGGRGGKKRTHTRPEQDHTAFELATKLSASFDHRRQCCLSTQRYMKLQSEIKEADTREQP